MKQFLISIIGIILLSTHLFADVNDESKQLLAVKKNVGASRFIKNSSEEVQLTAFKSKYTSLSKKMLKLQNDVGSLYQHVKVLRSDFTLKDVFGNTFHVINTERGLKIPEFTNKIVLISISPFTNPFYKKTTSALARLQKEYKNDIRIVNIIIRGKPEYWKVYELIQENNISHPIVMAKEGTEAEAFVKLLEKRTERSLGFPVLYVINKNGIYIGKVYPMRDAYNDYKKVIEKVKILR